jgi:hypothetical protein
MRRGVIAVLALAASLCFASSAFAVFHAGDMIVGGVVITEAGDSLIYAGKIRQFAPDGTLIHEFLYPGDGYTTDLKFGANGVLYGAGGGIILRLANDGSMLAPLNSSPFGVNTLAFDQSGNLFGTSGFGYVTKFGPDGVQQRVSSLGLGFSRWSDLGIDQCTLYHFGAPLNQIGRFNVCANTIMTPVQTQLTDSGVTLLVLRDGTLLASTDQFSMYHLKEDGSTLRHYATVGIAYARDLSPNFVWINTNGGFAKFDLQNDTIAAGPFPPGPGGVTGIAIVGADVAAIPAFSPLLLVLLALAVTVSALLRLRI